MQIVKDLLPQKIIIEFDGEAIASTMLFYKVNDGGVIGRMQSVSVKNADIKKAALNSLLGKFIDYAKIMEGAA
jgi:hypothetical protein